MVIVMDRRIFNNLFLYKIAVLIFTLILFCVLPITVKADSSDSILLWVMDDERVSGTYSLTVSDETYNIELYVFDDDVSYTSTPTVCSSTADNAMCILKYKKNLSLGANVVLTPQVRKPGFFVFVQGTLSTQSTSNITMTAKGSTKAGQNVYIWQGADGTYDNYMVPAVGAAGAHANRYMVDCGTCGTNASGSSGSTKGQRATGGGGGGALIYTNYGSGSSYGSAGSAGTSYAGGSGGGGANHCLAYTNANGVTGGGACGVNGSNYAQPGVGVLVNNSQYSGYRYNQTASGSGGLLIVYASILDNKGTISSNGVTTAAVPRNGDSFAYGGSSGGGSVNIFYGNANNIGTTQAIGGSGRASTWGRTAGSGAGGAGTVTTMKLVLDEELMNPSLSYLTVNPGSLNPSYDKKTLSYNVNLNSEQSKITIDGKAVSGYEDDFVITGLGTYEVNTPNDKFNVVVTSSYGFITIYEINTVRPASDYQYLEDIKINNESINGFNPTTLNYNVTVGYDTVDLDLDIVKGRTNQEVYLPSSLTVNSGNNKFEVVVISEDGTRSATYTLNVFKPHSSKLKSLSFVDYDYEPEFDPETLEYTIEIMSNTMSLNVVADTFDEEASISLKGFGYIKTSGNATITVSEPNVPSTTYRIKIIKGEFLENAIFEYPYTGTVQEFVAPVTGYYQLETWGAQGGSNGGYYGGYGAYSTGVMLLKKDQVLYVTVGGQGKVCSSSNSTCLGGYNGGGSAKAYSEGGSRAAGGGGATHISSSPGLLTEFKNNRDEIIVVSGGGGGGHYTNSANGGIGGSGGGATGMEPTSLLAHHYVTARHAYPGTQTAAGCNNAGTDCGGFGYGGSSKTTQYHGAAGSGGGGGYYGGSGANINAGGGGSGYIANQKLVSYQEVTKSMYCYNCTINNNESTYTVSTRNYSSTPTSYYAKAGDGYAKISMLKQPSENNFLSTLNVKATNYETEETISKTYTPSYDMSEEDYYLTLDDNETSITISAKPEDSTAKIEGLGTFDVPAGTTIFEIVVTAEAGNTKTYKMHVTRPANDNPYPNNIIINGLVPSLCSTDPSFCKLLNESNNVITFDKATHTYYLTVPSRIKQLYFNVDLGHPYQVLNGEGKISLHGGDNNLTITVLSEAASLKPEGTNLTENVDYSVYNFVVTRDMTGNTDLEEFVIIDPERDINYDPDVTEYYVSVPNEYEYWQTNIDKTVEDFTCDKNLDPDCLDILKLQMYLKTDDPNANYFVTGPEKLEVGMNVINVLVTAANGETKTYVLNVYRERNENTYLKSLTVSNGSTIYDLAPEFNKINTGVYIVTVPNEIDNVDINAIAEASTTLVTGTGNKELITTKANEFSIITTAEKGTIEIYKLSITREKNNNSLLEFLKVKDDNKYYDLSPEFDSEVLDYEITVDEGINKIYFETSTVKDTTTYRLLDGNNIKLGNNIKRIMAIAEDGSSRIYTIKIVRPASSNNYLSDIEVYNDNNYYDKEYVDLSNNKVIGFDKDILEYNVTVPNDVTSINVNGIRENLLATVSGNGRYSLNVGNNKVEINVISESKDLKTYIININREPNANAYLKTITTSEGIIVPDFNKDEKKYVVNIENNVNTFSASAIAEVSTTTINGGFNNETITINDIPTGSTEIKFVTLAEDGVTSLTYIIEVIKDKSDNDNLSYLLMEEGAISPTFNPDIIQYYVNVPYEVTKGTFHIELEDSKSSYVIKNNDNFVVGENEVIIEVTSESLLTKEYKVIVNRQEQIESDNYLDSLTVNPGNLSPSFNKNNQYYEVEVPYEINKVTLSGKLVDENATISGLGTYTLNVGKNLAIVKVTGIDGKVRDYQVVIIRQKNTDARLSSVTLNDATLSPSFDKDNYIYTTSTTDKTLSFSKIVTYDPNATYEIIGNELNTDSVNTVIIRVTAQDGVTTKDYIINVEKSPSNNNNLSLLEVVGFEINPKFSKTTTLYNLNVGNDVNNITINAIAEDEQSTINGDGTFPLVVGNNDFVITVTSESGKQKSYTIIINKEGSSNNYLSDLQVNNGIMNPSFDKELNNYDIEVEYEETTLDLSLLLEDSNATYSILNNDLKVGSNIVTVAVTAENGNVRNYILNVVRKEIVSPLLENIIEKNYKLSPEFNSYITNYNINVNYETEKLDLNVIPLDKNATYSISGNENFEIGQNIVTIDVVSSNGVDTETYILNVNRQPYANTFIDYMYTDQGDLTPSFEQSVMKYTIEVPYTTNNIELFGEAVDKSTTVITKYKGNLFTQIKGDNSLGSYDLDTGNNIIDIVVTSQSGVVRNYVITVIRNKNDDNYLASLTAKVGGTTYALNPEFSSTNLNYSIEVPVGTLSINVQGTTTSDTATVNGFGIYSLKAGDNIINIYVTSESGNIRTYTLTVIREANNNNMLIDLIPSVGELNPSFDYLTDAYTLNLDSGASFLSFDAVTEDVSSTVSGLDRMVVPDGTSTRIISVTAEDGSTHDYIITINKKRTDNALLSELYVEGYDFIDKDTGLSVDFDKEKYEYYIKVPNSKKVLSKDEVIAIAEDKNAIISKAANISLLTTTDNEYTLTVTAPDGFTKQTYKIFVIREKGNNTLLNSLVVNTGELVEAFNPNTFEYHWIVKRNSVLGTDSVTAVSQDTNATIEKTSNLVITQLEGNEYSVRVIAEDGTNYSEYILHVTYDLSGDGRLSSLELNKGYYLPTFDQDIRVYEAYEYIDTDEVEVSFTLNSENSKVLYGDGIVKLVSDLTVHEIAIEAEDGTIEIYTINIHKNILRDEGLNDLFLNGLDINLTEDDEGFIDKTCIDDKCSLNPTFNPDVIKYSIKVPYEYIDLDVYYERMNEQQSVKIRVNDEYVNDYKLVMGKNTVYVEVYDGMNNLTRTYELEIERCKSNNTYLKELTITNGLESDDASYFEYELTPEFDKHVQEYTIYVDKNVGEVTLNPVAEDEKASIYKNGYTYLEEGQNDATIIVTAPDGSTRTYIIHIIKSSAYNNLIKNITVSTGVFWDLNPKFKPTTKEYTTTVPSTATKVTVEAVPVDPTTIITGTGEYDIVTGPNVFKIYSTALGDGSVSIYTVTVIKEVSTNVNLQSLIVEEGDLNPNFEKGITKYKVNVEDYVNNLTIHAIPEDKTSTITITGNDNLVTGENTVNIIVQSEDKSTSKTYQLIVNKKPNKDCTLTNIKVYDDNNDYPLEPEFNKDQNSYNVRVNVDTEKVNILATKSSLFANVSGNGEEYLSYGNNLKSIIVTSESGDINIYYLNIYRPYNLFLSTLVSDKGTLSPIFNKETNEYTIDLANDEDEITFVALPESNKVTVTGSGTYSLNTGENNIFFTVSDPDNNTNTYKVIVNRAKDNNNYIKELNVDGILSPAFDKNTQEYQVDVRENVKSLSVINYILDSDTATAEIIGNSNFDKNKNPNQVTIRVTAENGDIRDYVLNVMLQPDIYFSNRLSSLTIDNGVLTPDFAPDINNYAATVSNSVSEINIVAIPENERAIVTGDGKVSLNVGRNVIPIIVKAQDGSINEYDIIVYRSEANDATLQSLSVTGQNFIPIFSKLTENYEMEIGSEIDELEVIAVPTDSGASVKISGNKNLVSGENTINIIVTAPDKITTKTYTIKVTKSVSKNNYLSDLNIPDYNFTTSFVKTNQGPYVVNVPSDVNTININATPEAKTSTVNGNGIIKLVGGKNVVTVKVTAESGDTRDYTIIVNKALSTDSTLKDILLSDESLDPVFNPSTHEYTVNVPEELDSITITGIVNDSSATITGNGTYDVYEDFIVDLVVTAEDGNKTTYKVNIHRDIPASSYLKQLIVKDGELYPGFHKLITNYTILVPNEVRSLNMEYAPEDEKATVTVTGNENFKVGTNKVHIVVTATDGTSTDYELAVVRQTIASNYLKSLSIDGYTIKPTFDKTNMYYEVTVPEDVDIVKIKASTEDSTSTLTGTGYFSLKVGVNTAYVTVESASGVIRTYQIVINRTASSENYLLTLESDVGTLSPIFDKEVKDYVLEVPDKTNKITLTGTASENSIVNGLGTYDVPLGETTRTITVTSQSGEVNTYTIKTVKNSATNTNLIDLIPSYGSINPEYSNDVLEYTMEVEDNVNVMSFLANPEDKDATVTTDDIMVLSYGENIYHVKVVAEDGITERNITIRINRKKDLKSITASEEKVFLDLNDTYNLSYTINPEDTTYPDVEWTIDDESIATIDENGLVKGIKYGSTIARITSKHDSTIYDTVNIIVMSKKILSSKYEIQRNEIDTPDDEKTIEYIIGIEPKTSIEDFKDNLDNENSMIFVYDLEGNEYSGSYVGTGLIVKYEFEGNVLDELTIVVRGDLNSDGDITTADYVKMKNYILKKVDFNEIEMIAGDLTKSSSIGTTDYVKLKNYILKKITSVN